MTEPNAWRRAGPGHRPRLAVLSLVCCATLWVGDRALANPCALPLRITEVHVDGLEDPGSEWFELTNAGSVPIDLSAWSFTDQATQGAATEGAIRFDAGMTLPAFGSIVIAYDGSQFQAERGQSADYEYGVDSAATIPYLARASDWSIGRTLSLANSADELLLVCGLVLRDAVRWGIASDERLAAPSPAYSDAAPQNGPRTFERQALDPWPANATGWVSSRCLSPRVAPNPDRAPALQLSRVLVPYGTAVELDLPGRDPDTAQPTFQLDTAGLLGTLTPLGNGRVRYTPPVTAVPLTTSFRFTVSDGCSTTHRERVELHVGPPACDPAQAELLLTEVAPGGSGTPTLAWVEITNPTAEEVDLSNLALGHGALSTNGLPQSGDGGLVIFPPGAIIEPGERLVVAYAAGAFRNTFSQEPALAGAVQLEWYRDSDLTSNELPLDPRGGRATVQLPRASGRAALYGCDGALIDSLVWGEAPPTGVGPLWTAPPPALADDPTPVSYARRSLVDTDAATDWFVARCPTPGASHTGHAPLASPASIPRTDLSALSSRFSATDADSPSLAYRGWASAGALTVAADGAFTFTPPGAGRYVLIFEASDGCLADQARVQVCVQTAEIPGNAEDEDCDGLAQCWADEDGDGFGGALVGVAPGLGCGGPGLTAVGGDCDDDPGECGEGCFPGADELCDGFDNDCAVLTADGAEDPRASVSCDAGDANACLDDTTLCVEGQIVCADSPTGDQGRIEVCDAANLDEDCDGAADDLDLQGAQGKALTYVDVDEDGYGAGTGALRCDPGNRVLTAGDCDDDPDRCGSFCSPGLTETRLANNCGDTFDNDCDGTTDLDEACFAPITCYLDLDRDGFGRATGAVTVTGPAAGQGCAAHIAPPYAAGSFVAVPGDCDDDPATCGAACRPGLPELCDGYDNDCQPATADGSTDVRVGASCDSPFDLDLCADDTNVCQAGALACPNDPDGDAGRIEVCDPLDVDEDCDGGADDADPGAQGGGAVGRVTVYRDLDGDGRGGEALLRCDLGAGLVAEGGDCDDSPATCGAACRPGLAESRGANNCADAFDNDCDGQTDSDPECFSLVLCYLDRDRDTFGDFSTERLLTGQPAASGCAAYNDGINPIGSWVGNGLDCDDDPAGCGAGCYPGATEVCDGIDNDCSAASADGSGDARVGASCDGPDGNACTDDRRACVAGGLACVDVPGGDEGRVEVCDALGADEDCDGGADDLDPDGPPVNAPTFYLDRDDDGFGDASAPARACVAPAGAATNALDCDDDPDSCGADCHPGRAELCDGRDNDCDRDTVDGSGDAGVGATCDAAADANLCEDDVGACVAGELACVDVTAGDENRVETCNASLPAIDEDCDGFADDLDPGGAEAETLYYRDRDEDGAGDPGDTTLACALPAGHVLVGGDCDDDPTACGASCAPGLDESAASGRCGDGLDNDCDGQTDRGPSCAAATCHLDKDGDGHGDPAVSTSLPLEALAAGCSAYDDGMNPVGVWVASGDDCDDLDEDVHPGATEVAGGEVDEDCDGQIACFTDADGDGFGTDPVALSPVGGCGEGLSSRGGDCDDRPSGCGTACSPSVPELCDLLDNDCDGQTDEVCDRPGVLGGGSGCHGGPGAWGWWVLLGLAALSRSRRLS